MPISLVLFHKNTEQPLLYSMQKKEKNRSVVFACNTKKKALKMHRIWMPFLCVCFLSVVLQKKSLIFLWFFFIMRIMATNHSHKKPTNKKWFSPIERDELECGLSKNSNGCHRWIKMDQTLFCIQYIFFIFWMLLYSRIKIKETKHAT